MKLTEPGYILNSEIKRISLRFADVMSDKYDMIVDRTNVDCGLNYCTSDSIQSLLEIIGITDDRSEDYDNDSRRPTR